MFFRVNWGRCSVRCCPSLTYRKSSHRSAAPNCPSHLSLSPKPSLNYCPLPASPRSTGIHCERMSSMSHTQPQWIELLFNLYCAHDKNASLMKPLVLLELCFYLIFLYVDCPFRHIEKSEYSYELCTTGLLFLWCNLTLKTKLKYLHRPIDSAVVFIHIHIHICSMILYAIIN